MAARKLTPGEISSTVEKIRRKYDDYITRYFKRKVLRAAFEKRYLAALKAGVDISSFLLAEISAIEELAEREEERLQAEPSTGPAEKKPSIADRILEENRKRIGGHPDIPFHPDASEEVRRLAGALSRLESERWGDLGAALRDTMYAMSSAEMLALDSALRAMTTRDGKKPPPFLDRLVNNLKSFPRNYAVISREEKEYILEAAFFLNDLHSIVERVKRVYTEMSAADARILEESMEYVGAVIRDFRLKDLKRRRRWDQEEENDSSRRRPAAG